PLSGNIRCVTWATSIARHRGPRGRRRAVWTNPRSDKRRDTVSLRKRRWTNLAGAGVAATLAAGIGLGGTTALATAESAQQGVALGGAQSARVEVRLDAGELKLHGGAAATDLLSGTFDYEADNGKPKFDYSVTDGRGELKVKPEDANDVHITWPWDMVDETTWDVALNDTVPTDLKVDVNAGKLDLAL